MNVIRSNIMRNWYEKDKQKLLNSLQTAAALKELQPLADKAEIQL